jgi:hypothetical protein
MKTTIKIIAFCLSILGLQNIEAQSVMLKGTIFFFPTDVGGFAVLDAGVETKINPTNSLLFSVGASTQSGEDLSVNKNIFTAQWRYHFKKENWFKSPFLGALVQRHSNDKGEGIYNPTYQGWKTTMSKKWGLGFIGGQNIQIYKRLGCEFHGGLISEMGDKNITTELIGTQKSLMKIKNDINVRPFLGFNFYLALGKVNPDLFVKKK